MVRRILKYALLTSTIAILAGCLSLASIESPALPHPGSDHYTLLEATAQSETGCLFNYRIFTPQQPISKSTVILGHGFMRDQNTLVGLSREMANQGIQVVTLNFCNMRLWNGNHLENAADMQKLARALGLDNVILGGFSAGALAAILAADEQTQAILALDLVDQNELGAKAITKLKTPLVGLHGRASSCNAYNNGKSVFLARRSTGPDTSPSKSILVEDASHCEFESPSNWLCELACGDDSSNDTPSDKQTRAHIIRSTIAAITPFLATP